MDSKESTNRAISKIEKQIEVELESVELESLTEEEYENVEKFCDNLIEHLEQVKAAMSVKSEDDNDSENEDT